MSDVNLSQPPGPLARPSPGIGLPKSPIGGPSGPGGSPMVSPGTGAGMQARAKQRLQGLLRNLMEMTRDFAADLEAFNDLAQAIRAIGRVVNKTPATEAPKTPLPVPPTMPGAGLGGMPGGPPTGLPTPGGGFGGIAPVAPE